ncbi:DUF6959 family protein [Tardiphaga sp. 813_E8_N1_3]|uniref:DUF6959 family protein n=1 Tax=Tardiphaga sp. 813_E8_N1_3 TaxID=3240760 RepID=UPI003F2378A1
MTKTAQLLSPQHNFAVVQLPQRQFPGVVIQGDTLNGLVGQLARMKSLLAAGDLQELASEIDDMSDLLASALTSYTLTCANNSIGTPVWIDIMCRSKR